MTNLLSIGALRALVAEGERKKIFCLHLSPTSVQNLRNFVEMYPNCTILEKTEIHSNAEIPLP